MLVSPCLEQQPKGKEEQRKRRRGECTVRELTLDMAAVGGGELPVARGSLRWRFTSPVRLSLQSNASVHTKTLAPGIILSFKNDSDYMGLHNIVFMHVYKRILSVSPTPRHSPPFYPSPSPLVPLAPTDNLILIFTSSQCI